MKHLRKIVGCSEATADYTLLNWGKLTPDANGMIHWHIVNFTPDMDKFKVILAFEKCFQQWQMAFDMMEPIGRAITLKSTDDFHEAKIKIYFLNPGERTREFIISDGSKITVVNNWPFTGPLGVLAHRPSGVFDLHFDESENWSEIHKFEPGDTASIAIQLFQVAMHEMGHIFDLGHSADVKAVMAPLYDGMHTELRKDDMDGLKAAWGTIKQQFAHLIPVASPIVCEVIVQHVEDALPKNKAYSKRSVDKITQIVVHHSADNGTVQSIANYHVSKGWPGIGYTFVIYKDGTIYRTNDIDEVCYNVANQNTKSLGICLIGNYEKETPPDAQVKSLSWLIKTLKSVIGEKKVIGHSDTGVKTECPGDNLYKLIKTL